MEELRIITKKAIENKTKKACEEFWNGCVSAASEGNNSYCCRFPMQMEQEILRFLETKGFKTTLSYFVKCTNDVKISVSWE